MSNVIIFVLVDSSTRCKTNFPLRRNLKKNKDCVSLLACEKITGLSACGVSSAQYHLYLLSLEYLVFSQSTTYFFPVLQSFHSVSLAFPE